MSDRDPDELPREGEADAFLFNAGAPPDVARDEIESALAGFDERRAQLLEALPRCFVTDEDSTGRAADFLSQLKVLRDDVDKRRSEIRTPYDDATRTVDAAARKWLTDVIAAIADVEGKIAGYRAEQRRLADAEQKRQAEEEAKLRAERTGRAEPPADLPPPARKGKRLPAARGDRGSSVHDTTIKRYRVVDITKVPQIILTSPAVIEAIERQCAVYAKLAGDEIPGVEVEEEIGIQHRKR